MAANSNSEPDWSTLPTGPLTSVAKRLPTGVDVLRYRAVCRNFRSSTTLSTEPRYPYPNLKIPATFLTDPDPGHLTLKQSSFYAIEQVRKSSKTQRKTKTKTWVLRVEELGYGLIFVKKPFCGDDYRNMHKKLPDCLNLLDYRVKEMGKIYDLEFIPDKESFYDTKVRCGKVVVSDDVSSVMTTLRGGRLVVWRNGDESWTEIDVGIGGGFGVRFEDLVFHKGKFYAVHTENLLISVDPKSLVHTEIGYLDLPFRHCKYFVKWSNDLFLVVKCFGSDYDEKLFGGRRRKKNDYSAESYPIGFLILKFEEEGHGLFPARNAFKDGMVFLGDDFSFCVSSMEFPGLRRNCVYLFDGVFGNPDDLNFDGEDDVHPGLSVGVYDLEKNTARPLSAFPDNIFWPPPTWLKHTVRLPH